MIIRMKKEDEKTDIETIRKTRAKAVEALVDYLRTYHPPQDVARSDSKHALMGPVGKLFTRITVTGDVNWGAVKGYVLSIHKNQQAPRGIGADAPEKLDAAISVLTELKELLPATKWLRTVEDLDDEVFFGAYKNKLVAQRAGLRKKFQQWLERKFQTVDRLNEMLPEEEHYATFHDVDDPYSVPPSMHQVVTQFWDETRPRKEDEA